MPRAVRRAVAADAARRFAVSENEVVLVNAERLTWSDGAMGCPEPGQMYTQMLVPGFRVTAKTSAGQMLYHTDSRGTAVTCAAHDIFRQDPSSCLPSGGQIAAGTGATAAHLSAAARNARSLKGRNSRKFRVACL